MTRAQQLAHLVRAAAARIRRPTVVEEIRGEYLSSIRALMEAHRVARWAAHGVYERRVAPVEVQA